MKKYTALFLILAMITGLVGFTGLRFTGIEVVRVLNRSSPVCHRIRMRTCRRR